MNFVEIIGYSEFINQTNLFTLDENSIDSSVYNGLGMYYTSFIGINYQNIKYNQQSLPIFDYNKITIDQIFYNKSIKIFPIYPTKNIMKDAY